MHMPVFPNKCFQTQNNVAYLLANSFFQSHANVYPFQLNVKFYVFKLNFSGITLNLTITDLLGCRDIFKDSKILETTTNRARVFT